MNERSASDARETVSRRHHMVIAGTGRAGTSFLVRYLSALGLETEIDRSGFAEWDENANAGLETKPIVTPSEQLPYVIKAPWMSQFIEQVLAQQDLAIDVAVVPVRGLVESAASRVILEMRAIHERANWMVDFDETWELWCSTPGGVLYSLNPVDQARILAVGFHRLVHRLVEADIPIVFVEFPRMVADADYLFAKLRSFLPENVSVEIANAAHGKVADVEKVRTGAELTAEAAGAASDNAIPGLVKHSEHEQLDRIAIRRELRRLHAERAGYEDKIATMRAQHDAAVEAVRREADDLRIALKHAQAAIEVERDGVKTERESVGYARAERDTLRRERDALLGERGVLLRDRDTALSEREAAMREYRAILASRSWRLTVPFRAAARVARSLVRRR